MHIFLTSALAGGEWLASRPGHFTPGERAPCTHWIEGSVGARARLDDVEKRKYLTLPGLELRPLGRNISLQVSLPEFRIFVGEPIILVFRTFRSYYRRMLLQNFFIVRGPRFESSPIERLSSLEFYTYSSFFRWDAISKQATTDNGPFMRNSLLLT
jgi:hypothetical protein